MTVLNLLAGILLPVKVHSTSHSTTEPTHALILCNTLPDDYVVELESRTDVVNIQKYDRRFTIISHLEILREYRRQHLQWKDSMYM